MSYSFPGDYLQCMLQWMVILYLIQESGLVLKIKPK